MSMKEDYDRLAAELDIERRLRKSYEADFRGASSRAAAAEKKTGRIWTGIKILALFGAGAALLVRTDRGKAAFEAAQKDIASRIAAGEALAASEIQEIIGAAERNFGVSLSTEAKTKILASNGAFAPQGGL